MRNIPIKLIKDATYCVNYLVYSNGKGKREYIYIASRHDQMLGLKAAIQQGNFIAEDFGMVLEHGEGEASDITKEKMKMLYNCDHENGLSVADFDETA